MDRRRHGKIAFRDFTWVVEDLHLTPGPFTRETALFAFKCLDRRNLNVLSFDDVVAWLNEYGSPDKVDAMRQSTVTLSASKTGQSSVFTPEKLRRST